MSGITDDLKHSGYDQEEAYFHADNKRKLKALKEKEGKEGCDCKGGCNCKEGSECKKGSDAGCGCGKTGGK